MKTAQASQHLRDFSLEHLAIFLTTDCKEGRVEEGVALCWTPGMLLELLQQPDVHKRTNIQDDRCCRHTECAGGVSVFSLSLSLSTHLPLTGRNRPACGPCRNTDLVPGCLSEPVWRQEWGTFPKLRWPPPGKTQHQELHVDMKLHRDSTKLGPFPFLIQQDASNKHETPPSNNCVKL